MKGFPLLTVLAVLATLAPAQGGGAVKGAVPAKRAVPAKGGGNGNAELASLRRPLSKVEALNIALAHNGTILQAQKELEAAAGVSIQIKAIVFPQLLQKGQYRVRQDSLIEANQNREIPKVDVTLPALGMLELGGGNRPRVNNQEWSTEIRLVQSLYEGGRMLSALRSSKLIREQAVLAFESTAADILRSVSIAYDDVLSTAKQIEVREASVKLLSEYLRVARIKAAAGAVTEFDVLRQEVEVANAEAALVQAVGAHRVAKQVFVEQLGQDLPVTVSDDLPLNLTSPLEARPYRRELSSALAAALLNRTEIGALQKEEQLRDENIITAKAGAKPSVQTRNAGDELHGGFLGGQVSWPIFDGFLTKGRVVEAVALRGKAGEAKAETMRIVELQVRTAWSGLRTARAVLDAEAKTIGKAATALGLVQMRYDEGAATQVEVLSAQTALTDARTTFVQVPRPARLLRGPHPFAPRHRRGPPAQWHGGKMISPAAISMRCAALSPGS